MKKIAKVLSVALLSLVGINAASANQGDDNWYMAGTGALSFHNDTKFFKDKVGGTEQDYKMGGGASFAVGRTMDCWRFELEMAYRRNKVKNQFDIAANGQKNQQANKNVDGYNRDLALMANAYYDLPLCDAFGIYVGGGLGVSFNEVSFKDVDGNGHLNHSYASYKNTLFAYQAMTGVFYDLNECWTLTLGYRLFGTSKPKVDSKSDLIGGINANTQVKSSKMPISHNIEFGVRYKF